MDVHPPQNGAIGSAPWPNRFVSSSRAPKRLKKCRSGQQTCSVRARFVPGSCPVRAQFVNGSRTVRARFVHGSRTDRARIAPGSCPVRARFVPGSCPVRARFVPGSCPVRARFVPGSCPARARLVLGFCCEAHASLSFPLANGFPIAINGVFPPFNQYSVGQKNY